MPDPTTTLLVADDDPGLRESLERTLTREGYRVVLASDGHAALERLQGGGIDLVLTDLKMPGLTGIEVLRAAKAIAPDVDVILLTAFGTVEEAVRAMKDGAYDFLTKPFQRAQLLRLIRTALERRDLIQQNRALQQRLDDLLGQGAIIGASPAYRRMMTLVEQVADSSATVLIQGESGTGKELVARTIHEKSGRRRGPFVAVNCAALPETLLESELFGYERGAFTGAAGRKEGRFELADGGTLFLDEVADLSAVTQPKILRVLQEGEYERLGGTRTLRVDVRIVAATNQDLARMVRDRRFREDLYYRLNVITVVVPPLRERREDILLLARHFVRIYAAKNNRRLEGLTDDAARRLEAYSWPGNVRELENVIERGVVLARGSLIDVTDLPEEIAGATPLPEGVLSVRIGTPLAEIEARLLDATLRATKGNKTLTAKLLGIDPRTVSRKLERQEDEARQEREEGARQDREDEARQDREDDSAAAGDPPMRYPGNA
jgi:two-component system response regulator HydG